MRCTTMASLPFNFLDLDVVSPSMITEQPFTSVFVTLTSLPSLLTVVTLSPSSLFTMIPTSAFTIISELTASTEITVSSRMLCTLLLRLSISIFETKLKDGTNLGHASLKAANGTNSIFPLTIWWTLKYWPSISNSSSAYNE